MPKLPQTLPRLPITAISRVKARIIPLVVGAVLFTSNIILANQQGARYTGLNALLFFLGVGIYVFGSIPPGFLHIQLENYTSLRRMANFLGIYPSQVLMLAASLPLALTAGTAAMQETETLRNPWMVIGLWLMAILLVMLGSLSMPETETRLPWKSLLAPGLFFLLGLSTRIFNLEGIPVSWTGDEGASGLTAIHLLQLGNANPFSGAWHHFPSFYFIIQSTPLALLDRSMTALRLSSALAGALNVSIIYLVGKSLFGKRAGILGAILLAGMHFHIHFSRIGLNNIWDSLWYTITLGTLWVAWKREQRNAFLLTGISLGLAQYFYPSARLLACIILLWLVIASLLDRPRFWRTLPDLIVMGLATLTVILPSLMYFSIRFNAYLWPVAAQYDVANIIARGSEQHISAPLAILMNIGKGLGAFVTEPLQFWYRPATPILRPPEAILFIIGLVALLWRPKDARLYLLGLWLLTFGVIGGLSESTPAAQRYIAAAPVAILVAALGLDTTGKIMKRLLIPAGRKWVTATVILLAATLAANDAWFYFQEYTPNSYYTGKYDFEGEGGVAARELARYLLTQPDNYTVVYAGYPRISFYSVPSLQFIAPQFHGTDLQAPWGQAGNPPIPDNRVIFAFLADKTDDLAAARQENPDGYLREVHGEYGQPVLYIYQIPAPTASPDTQNASYQRVFSPLASGLLGFGILALLALFFGGIVWLNRFAPNAESITHPEKIPFKFQPAWLRKSIHKLVNQREPLTNITEENRQSLPNPQVSIEAIGDNTARISVEIPLGTSVNIRVQTWPPRDEKSAEVTAQAEAWYSAETPRNAPNTSITAKRASGRFRSLRAQIGAWPLATWLFTGAILLYFLMTSIGLEKFPIFFFTDEAVHMNQAANFIKNGFKNDQGEFLPTYFSIGPSFSINSVSVYAQVLPYLLFGKSIFVSRFVSALITLLGAIAISLSLKRVFNSRVHWAGILFLITSPGWFYHARTTFEYMELAAFYAIFLYFYMRYLENQPKALFGAVIAGALTFYTHGLGQVLMGVTGLLLLVIDFRHHFKKENRRELILALGLLALLAVPYARYQLAHPATTAEQIRQRGSYLFDNSLTMPERAMQLASEYASGLNPLYWFTYSANDLIRHKMLGYSYLWIEALPFLALGLFTVIKNIHHAQYRVPLIALLASPLPASLVEVSVTRMLWMFVPVALISGIGLGVALDWLEGKYRWRFQLISVVAFAIMSIFGVYMLQDSLRNGPTWFEDYTLYGMQYGAKQVFQDTAFKMMKENPNLRFAISPNWMNGTDQAYLFFLTEEYLQRSSLESIDAYMSQKKDLDSNLIFIATPDEYQRTRETPKFKDVTVLDIIPYPNGKPGFYLLNLTYADNIDQVMEEEALERQKPVTGTLDIDGQTVDITYSRITTGELNDLLDGDPYSLIRGLQANPFVFELRFPAPRAIHTLTMTTGTMDKFSVTVRLYEPENSTPVEYVQEYKDLGTDPTITLSFENAPASVQRMDILIHYDNGFDTAEIHIRDMSIQ